MNQLTPCSCFIDYASLIIARAANVIPADDCDYEWGSLVDEMNLADGTTLSSGFPDSVGTLCVFYSTISACFDVCLGHGTFCSSSFALSVRPNITF